MANEISPDSLVSRRTILFLWLGTIIVISITFLLVYFKKSPAPAVIALHYNVITGVDLLGPSRQLYVLPVAGVIIAVMNFILYRQILPKNELLPFLTAVVSLAAGVILLLAVIFILSLA